MKIISRKKGFIALMTAIILSVILLTVATTLNQTGFWARSEVLDSEYKDKSSALAEGCVDTVLLNLANNSSYIVTTPASVNIESDACSIDAVSTTGAQTTINTSAVFPALLVTREGARTRLQIVVNSDDLSIVSWEELP